MKLLLSFLLLTTLTWQVLAQSCPSNAAPNDQVPRCVTDDPMYAHTYPDDWRVLMDSINYLELIDDRDGVWERNDVDRTGTVWQQAGGICSHEAHVCEFNNSNPQAMRNNWFFTQYICYLNAREVIVNVTYTFTGCFGNCRPQVTFHRYERDDPNVAAARDPNSYDQLRVVTGRSGFGLNLGNTVFRFRPSSNSRGFYIGVQDTGSCVSIRRLILYYRISPGRTEGVTVIPEIALPPEGSTEPSTGVASCLGNSTQQDSLQISCDNDGVCTDDPVCVCRPGFEFTAATANSAAECTVCPRGTYQARNSNDFPCQECPPNSASFDEATAVCQCDCGFELNGPDECIVANATQSTDESDCGAEIAITFFITWFFTILITAAITAAIAWFLHNRSVSKGPHTTSAIPSAVNKQYEKPSQPPPPHTTSPIPSIVNKQYEKPSRPPPPPRPVMKNGK